MNIIFIIRRDACCILLVKKISCFACATVLMKYSQLILTGYKIVGKLSLNNMHFLKSCD